MASLKLPIFFSIFSGALLLLSVVIIIIVKWYFFVLSLARGKKKKKIKQLLPILLLLKLKLAALIPLFLGIIAFAALKAVFLGKIAFAMNAFTLIRKLLAKGGHGSGGGSISYSSPHHHEEHQGGYNYEPAQGWSSRQGSDAASMAYSGQLRKWIGQWMNVFNMRVWDSIYFCMECQLPCYKYLSLNLFFYLFVWINYLFSNVIIICDLLL